MKTIVIAAGYATRLYPVTENFPKPLLEIGKSTILDRMLDDIDTIPEIEEHIVVTNGKFAEIFREWAGGRDFSTRPPNHGAKVRHFSKVLSLCFRFQQVYAEYFRKLAVLILLSSLFSIESRVLGLENSTQIYTIPQILLMDSVSF